MEGGTVPSRQYAPKDFLRRVPNVLSGRYFHDRGLLTHLDFTQLPETDVEPIFEAWQDLPEDTRAGIDRDFQDVHFMADEQGLRTTLEEARHHGEQLEDLLAEQEGFHAQAMWSLLDRRTYFDVAVQFKEADELPPRYWEQRNNFPDVLPRHDRASCDQFAGILRSYFRKEGRGSMCVVEPYRRDERYYFFAYVEDHARTLLEFQSESLIRRVVRPTFDVVFVFNPSMGTLATFCLGSRKARRDLQELFSWFLLSVGLPNQPQDERVYNLDLLKSRDFQFVIDPRTGVQELRLKQLKLLLPGSRKARWTVDVDPNQGPEAIYEELERLFATEAGQAQTDRFPLGMTRVLRVEVRAYFVRGPGRRRPTRTFYLSYPNGCNLDHEGRDATLRETLIASGIEPRPYQAGTDAA